MRARRWCIPLAAFPRIRPAACCSTAAFDAVYQKYPDCAAACLACEDIDYSNNFAHSCNYTAGECCQSQHHTAISATWACVSSSCGADLAQQAFDTFVAFCNDRGQPLVAADVPTGYRDAGASGSSGSAGDTNGTGPSPRLSNGEIAGTVIGAVAGAAGIIAAIYGYLTYKKKKESRPSDTENMLQVIHRGQQPHQLGIPAALFHGNADASVIYTRETQSTSFLSGKHVTKETFEIRREGGVVTGRQVVEEDVD